MESMEFMSAEAVAVVDWDCETGLLEARRNGERTGLASDATRNADRPAEHDRNIDLAAADAIFVIGIVWNRRRENIIHIT
ncbi:hypothetical protein CR513_04088, partial [Mucuna pruriens]